MYTLSGFYKAPALEAIEARSWPVPSTKYKTVGSKHSSYINFKKKKKKYLESGIKKIRERPERIL